MPRKKKPSKLQEKLELLKDEERLWQEVAGRREYDGFAYRRWLVMDGRISSRVLLVRSVEELLEICEQRLGYRPLLVPYREGLRHPYHYRKGKLIYAGEKGFSEKRWIDQWEHSTLVAEPVYTVRVKGEPNDVDIVFRTSGEPYFLQVVKHEPV